MAIVDQIKVQIVLDDAGFQADFHDLLRLAQVRRRELDKVLSRKTTRSRKTGGSLLNEARDGVGQVRRGADPAEVLFGKIVGKIAKRNPFIALALETAALGFETLAQAGKTTAEQISITTRRITELQDFRLRSKWPRRPLINCEINLGRELDNESGLSLQRRIFKIVYVRRQQGFLSINRCEQSTGLFCFRECIYT